MFVNPCWIHHCVWVLKSKPLFEYFRYVPIPKYFKGTVSITDGKEYDAFVSYKSTPEDEKFVLQYLYPKLETEFRFKLCLHFRDFMPGEGKSVLTFKGPLKLCSRRHFQFLSLL